MGGAARQIPQLPACAELLNRLLILASPVVCALIDKPGPFSNFSDNVVENKLMIRFYCTTGGTIFNVVAYAELPDGVLLICGIVVVRRQREFGVRVNQAVTLAILHGHVVLIGRTDMLTAYVLRGGAASAVNEDEAEDETGSGVGHGFELNCGGSGKTHPPPIKPSALDGQHEEALVFGSTNNLCGGSPLLFLMSLLGS